MSRFLLIAWIALLGADRLDLAGGTTGAVLTPFLVLTPVLLLVQWRERAMEGRPLVIPANGVRYISLLLATLCVIGVSIFASADVPTSTARVVLVVLQSLGALAVALHVWGMPSANEALERGAMLGILACGVMDLLAMASFLGLLPQELPLGLGALRLDSYGYAGIIPRLSGTTLDPNRGGFLLLFFMALSRRWRGWGVALLLLTLSRSAVLAGVAMMLVTRGAVPLAWRPAPVRAVSIALVAVAALVLAIGRSPDAVERMQELAKPFAERLSLGESTSGSEHQSLLVRAADVATRSPSHALVGIGWGTSFTVLEDVFPGNRYGNFHSLYATALVEAGFPAALLVTLLLLVPAIARGPWRGIAAASVIFSITYQATAEPAFWFALAMGWLTLAQLRRVPAGTEEVA